LRAFIGQGPGAAVIAFRGSQPSLTAGGRADWLLTDARRLLVRPPAGGLANDLAGAGPSARLHEGFLAAPAALWGPLRQGVRAAGAGPGRPLWLTGHSLGGAPAALAAWRLDVRGLPAHRACTFGAPMFGDGAAAAGCDCRPGGRLYRVVNEADLVPALPLSRLLHNAYRHAGVPVVLPAAPAAPLPAAGGLPGRLRALAEVLDVPLAAGRLPGRELVRRASAHALGTGYLGPLQAAGAPPDAGPAGGALP
jgi:hypothetical protein